MRWSRKTVKIQELFELYKKYSLILQPFFQRNLVWTEKGKSHFLESILLGMPISEVFLSVVDGKYSVIDGQQRLSTIFHFIENKIKLQNLENLENLNGFYFQDLSKIDLYQNQSQFLNYEISIVEITEPIKEEVIDMYSRINKYTVNLNDQELRKAAFSDSDFLKLSEDLSELDFFDEIKMFTPKKRQRMQDVEFISELLCIQFDTIQDKKLKLDTFYNIYTELPSYSQDKKYFISIIEKIENIFGSNEIVNYYETRNLFGDEGRINLSKTRFKQFADFYSLFFVIKEFFFVDKQVLDALEITQLAKILLFFDEMIEPESDIDLFREYAIKCISQGNTAASRTFRANILLSLFSYVKTKELNEYISNLQQNIKDVFNIDIDFLDFNVKEVLEKIDLYYNDIIGD